MTDGLSLSITSPGAIPNWPPADINADEESDLDSLDLTVLSRWIEEQSTTIPIAAILDLIGNDLYRRGLYATGDAIKAAVVELRA